MEIQMLSLHVNKSYAQTHEMITFCKYQCGAGRRRFLIVILYNKHTRGLGF